MRSLLVIGTGLLGGSFAKAAKTCKLFDRIVGIDRDRAALDQALELGFIDDAHTPGSHCDAVCVAVPVRAIAGHVRDAADGCTGPLFDLGSVKESVIEALDPVPPNFVPCHPIAGSDLHGPGAARADLFDDRVVVMTPVDETDEGAVEVVRGYWEAVGARVVVQTPADHDNRFALISHLPHLVAFAFMDAAARAGPLDQAGNGFRDFVRIAGADVDVWTDILHANASRVRPRLDELMETLDRFATAMDDGTTSLRDHIASAVQAKRAFDAADR